MLLREENEKLRLENAAMIEVLKNVTCPPCGGPPFGRDDRESNLHKMRLENAFLKTEVIIRFYFSKPTHISILKFCDICLIHHHIIHVDL